MNSTDIKEHAPINWVSTSMFIVTTLVAVTLVPWYGITYGYDTSAWVAFVALTFLTGMSITGGYHRLWSHNAYEAHPILRVWYALWGAAALENTILDWCSGHRVHHRHCDDLEKDPYSAKRGLWFSHMGWMLREYPSGRVDFKNVKNLMKDPIVMWQYKYYVPITLAMNIGVPVGLGLIFDNVWAMVLLAGFLRIVVAHHITFFINSIAHKWGSQPYTDENTARDNAFFAVLTHGEGYHNYHHIFQNDYRNGIRWFHWDPTKWFIKACSWVGLTSNLKTVPDYKIQRAVVKMQFKRAQEKLAKAECPVTAAKWTALLEHEYEKYHAMLNQWAEHQSDRLDETRKNLKERWENTALHQNIIDIEEQLMEQSQRLKTLMADYKAALA
ncbi:MAG: fatty acid desaturase [Oleibacter sp.]|nr:fatty acid desaturase [Thalassolituus sp.]